MLIVFLLSQNFIGDRQLFGFATACGLSTRGHLRAHHLHPGKQEHSIEGREQRRPRTRRRLQIAGTATAIC
jgi:hypothetical protein